MSPTVEPRVDTSDAPEPPPRGVRVMAVVRWVLLLAVAALAAHTLWRYGRADSRETATQREDRYYCPMHPQIRSHDPGECPICHMNLEPIPLERRQAHGDSEDAHVAAASSTADSGVVAPRGLSPVTITLERQQLVGITTAPVVRRMVGAQLRAPGVVEAPEGVVAQVHVRAPGFLERVAVRETGVRVARGQTLAWIYSPQIYQAQQELLVAHRWSDGRAPATPASEQSTALAAAARRTLELFGMTAADIDAMVRAGVPTRAVPVRAPAGGYVTQRAAVLGLYATPETTLYEIADLSRVWVVASVYERDLPRIQRGTAAHFVTPAAPDAPVVARVALIEPAVTAATRTARVRLEVNNASQSLRPGQYGDITFDLPASEALVVPRDAVVDTGEQQYAFVDAGDGRFEPRRVHTGALYGNEIHVLDGLHEGDRVVTRGNFMLDSESRLGAALTTVPAAPTPPAVRP